jgi:uncharacterized protein YkwD
MRFKLAMIAVVLCRSLSAVAANPDEVEIVEPPRGASFPDPSRRPPVAEVAPGIVEGTNAFRKEQGRGDVTIDESLTKAAQDFAEYMAAQNKFGHTADGRQPDDRATAAGYKICLISENIAYRFDSEGFEKDQLAKSFVQGWIDSPGHRKNMLEPNAVHIGIGVAWSDEGIAYGVQMFGRPESMILKFSVVNRTKKAVKLLIDDQAIELPPNATLNHGICAPATLKIDGAPDDQAMKVEKNGAFNVIEVKGAATLKRTK